MCGRYYRRSDKQRIAEAFKLGKLPEGFVLPEWDYNVAPSTFQPIIRADKETGDRELVLMRWGLVPFFTKQLSDVKGVSTINARAETVEKSPSFRTPFKKRRCLVPADGFYEWKKIDPKTKQPFAFRMGDGAPFAFAGLWDAWKDPNGNWLQSFSIITTDANELMAPVHNRMPVILHARDYARWLEREAEGLPLDLLRPYEAEVTSDAPFVMEGVMSDRVEAWKHNDTWLYIPICWQAVLFGTRYRIDIPTDRFSQQDLVTLRTKYRQNAAHYLVAPVRLEEF